MSNEAETAGLSPRGRKRRQEMLGLLLAEMRRTHRVRRLRRRIRWALAVVAVAAGVFLLVAPPEEPAARVAGPPSTAPPPSVQPMQPVPRVRVTVVRTRTDRLAEYLVDPARVPRLVELIDDNGLMIELAWLNPGAGLVRVGDQAWVTGLSPQRRR